MNNGYAATNGHADRRKGSAAGKLIIPGFLVGTLVTGLVGYGKLQQQASDTERRVQRVEDTSEKKSAEWQQWRMEVMQKLTRIETKLDGRSR